MRNIRLTLGSAGILLALFGVFRLLTQVPFSDLLVLALWLVAAVAIHDGVLSPIVVGIGVLLAKYVPPRARRYLQGGLVAGALVTAIAVPMISQQGTQPPQKAILRQNFTGNLLILLAVIALASVLLYAVNVARAQSKRGGSVRVRLSSKK